MSRFRRYPRLAGPIVIRESTSEDAPALARLAELDDRRLPGGSFLLAEVGGRLVAAAPLDADAEPIADPFLPTAEVRELLRLRVRQLRWREGALTLPEAA